MMNLNFRHIYFLGIKELRSFSKDLVLLIFVVYAFTLGVYLSATRKSDSLHHASLAIIDEDRSVLTQRLTTSFFPPQFLSPELISSDEMEDGLDYGRYTFVIDFPPNFLSDILQGNNPAVQLNVDATRMSQAFNGSGYIQSILLGETGTFLQRNQKSFGGASLVGLITRAEFNPSLDHKWFGSIIEIINNITMLSIALVGAALIREREHGTLEHLLVMPVTSMEIMLSKVWSMSVIVLLATAMALFLIVKGFLGVPIAGSIPLFFFAALLHLFAVTSLGIFLSTLARSMPQFGLLMILVLLPLQILSGGMTPRESMPEIIQHIMLAAPNTHFVKASQAVLFRGAGVDVIWPSLLSLVVIGVILIYISHTYFKKSLQ